MENISPKRQWTIEGKCRCLAWKEGGRILRNTNSERDQDMSANILDTGHNLFLLFLTIKKKTKW